MNNNREVSECPMKHEKNIEGGQCPIKLNDNNGPSTSWSSYFFGNNATTNVTNNVIILPPSIPLIPEIIPPETVQTEGYNPAANDLAFGSERNPDQTIDMSRSRAVSSIPKSSFNPHHQPKDVDRWVYPSEQQYYNAMKRKGYNPEERDISVILAIHNLVNEQGWSKIKEWEEIRGCSEPKLKQFRGRPKDISPKAYIRSFLGYSLPFDRHDWIVERDGKDVRYIIDFYNGKSIGPPNMATPISIYLDIRPALDSPTALIDTASAFYRENIVPLFSSFNKVDNSKNLRDNYNNKGNKN